ncbi:MAG: type I DNA topoisomerase [Bacteriovoracaceae bacterium]|jgi:DNA topoisomerase-1|nr:type I DNA topoisomerase [Bacteriovoracaceae bacterium]
MEKYLVIVESPTKAKTIRKFLPKNYIVEASMGHVRDLPQSASDIPAKFKKEDWAKIGVNIENDFEPLYVVPKGKSKIVTALRKQLKECSMIYLATDEDREGESISWHLMQLLKPKVPVKRMVFHEITKKAITKALEETRELDEKLVKAQEARRIVDRLYGYTLSPLIWKKIAYGLSAGRVQSTGLRFIVERERERMKFIRSQYWDLKAGLYTKDKAKDNFEAKLLSVGGKRIATGKDFDSTTGKLAKKDVHLLDEKKAKDLTDKLKKSEWKVISMDEKESTTRPTTPFITSSLQMEGIRKLGLSAKNTMRIAQKLYEEGLITYMRTDSPNLSTEAINGARGSVESLYGKEYLSDKPRQFSSKSKGAQEAHEAIRPAGSEFKHPDEINFTGKEKALYELIWKRTLASQMKEAKKLNLSVRIEADDCIFSANGSRITFPGFLRVYVEGNDDPEKALDDKEVILPKFSVGDTLNQNEVNALFHETKPPARFTEASLVQRLEKEGVGRPSTYASIISTIQDRGYVRKEGSALVPSFTGVAVCQLLEKNFSNFVDYGFTSAMEEKLDMIATGDADNLEYLKSFYKGKKGLKESVDSKEKEIKPEESRTITLDTTEGEVEVKVGRYGPYIISIDKESKEEVHASIPEEIAPADLKPSDIDELIEISKKGPEPIGTYPDTGEPIFVLVGRYGPYFQLGEATEENPKPKRASLPKGMSPRSADVALAVKLLSLPRVLGNHPTSGKEIAANIGRFGPYVMHDGEFRSLKATDDVYTITLERGLELINEPRGSRGAPKIKDFGKIEELKKKVAIYDGKYGIYLKAGTKNIGLPEELRTKEKAEALTEKEVIEIVKKALKK